MKFDTVCLCAEKTTVLYLIIHHMITKCIFQAVFNNILVALYPFSEDYLIGTISNQVISQVMLDNNQCIESTVLLFEMSRFFCTIILISPVFHVCCKNACLIKPL